MAVWLHEAQYSLVVFTVLIQLAVGGLWVLVAADLRPAPLRTPAGRVRPPGQPPSGVGGRPRPALLHDPPGPADAGRPGPAALGELWMSREIWATGLFFGLIALYTVLWWWRPEAGKARRSIGALGTVVQAPRPSSRRR